LSGFPKQQRRADKEHDEKRIASKPPQYRGRPGRNVRIPDNQRARQDQGLSKGGRKQGACHAGWPETRYGGTDDPHKGHSEIHYCGTIDVEELDEVPPGEEERRRKRNADRDSVRDCVHVPGYELIRKTNAEEESADNNKGATMPVPSKEKNPQ
jgi:hypothetical protein